MINIKVLVDEENYLDQITDDQIEYYENLESTNPDEWTNNPRFHQPFIQINDNKICQAMLHEFGYGGFSDPMYVESWTISLDESIVVICATVSCMQGGVIIIWDNQKKKIINVKDGSYCFCAAYFEEEIFVYMHVQNYCTNKGPYIMKTPLISEEWEEFGVSLPDYALNIEKVSMKETKEGLFLEYKESGKNNIEILKLA